MLGHGVVFGSSLLVTCSTPPGHKGAVLSFWGEVFGYKGCNCSMNSWFIFRCFLPGLIMQLVLVNAMLLVVLPKGWIQSVLGLREKLVLVGVCTWQQDNSSSGSAVTAF